MKLKHYKLLSNFAFKFSLRHYNLANTIIFIFSGYLISYNVTVGRCRLNPLG